MSRSFKQHPFAAICGKRPGSQKWAKRHANKCLRQAFRVSLARDMECPVPPLIREVSNVYDFPTDGNAHWFGDVVHPRWNESLREWNPWSGPEPYRKMMRK
jgi:hypothetical protein